MEKEFLVIVFHLENFCSYLSIRDDVH